MNTSYRPGSRALGDQAPQRRGPEFSVELEQGAVDQGDVEDAIARNWSRLSQCYARAGQAQRFAGGRIQLRFLLEADGGVRDVLVVESEVGNFAVERCLVVEGRRIRFPAPEGGKATSFDYPIQFRSTGELSVVDWPPGSSPAELDLQMEGMQPCPGLPGQGIEAVAYVEPSGALASVGLASSSSIDPEAAMCAIEQMRGWRLAGEPGHVVRARFALRVPRERRGSAVAAPATPARATPGAATQGKRPPARRGGR